MSAAAPTALPPLLAANPRLDQWVGFDQPGRVRVSTGRVEIGQGVLTAMRQIAAEELDVSLDRIMLQSGDTELTPNEGYTAGSQSIQFGGVAMRFACAEVRSLFLDHAAAAFGYPRAELSVQDGAIARRGEPIGHDYWSLAAAIDLGRHATGRAPTKQPRDYRVVGQEAPRVDLAAKVFGEPVFLHDMGLDGMTHARVVRQPRRGATIKTVDEAALRRAAKTPIEIIRNGNFLAITGADETAVEAVAAVAPSHVVWDGVDPINPFQEEARWLLQQPAIDRVVGAPPPSAPTPAASRYEATYTRMHIAHASVAPSCGVALYRDGRLDVWTHSQGVYPLRDALARTLKLDPAMIRVTHVQGPGCYGHNGADDAAADAAVIAMHTPGTPIRVRWRREEEFGFEPVSPAMVVTARATLDDAGRPVDWTTEIWSGRHSSRPGRRRQPARCRGAARPAAPAAGDQIVEPAGRGHPQRRAALRIFGKAHRPPPDSRKPRCGPRRCAGSAPRSTSLRSNRRWTRSPSAPARTRSRTGCRYYAIREGGRSSSTPHGSAAGGAGCRPPPDADAGSGLRATRTWRPMPLSSPKSRSTKRSG